MLSGSSSNLMEYCTSISLTPPTFSCPSFSENLVLSNSGNGSPLFKLRLSYLPDSCTDSVSILDARQSPMVISHFVCNIRSDLREHDEQSTSSNFISLGNSFSGTDADDNVSWLIRLLDAINPLKQLNLSEYWVYIVFMVCVLTFLGWALMDPLLTVSLAYLIWQLVGFYVSKAWYIQPFLTLPLALGCMWKLRVVYLVTTPLLLCTGSLAMFPASIFGNNQPGEVRTTVDKLIRWTMISLSVTTYFLLVSLFRHKSRAHHMRTAAASYWVAVATVQIFQYRKGESSQPSSSTGQDILRDVNWVTACCSITMFCVACSFNHAIEKAVRLQVYRRGWLSEYRTQDVVVNWWHPFIRAPFVTGGLHAIRKEENRRYRVRMLANETPEQREIRAQKRSDRLKRRHRRRKEKLRELLEQSNLSLSKSLLSPDERVVREKAVKQQLQQMDFDSGSDWSDDEDEEWSDMEERDRVAFHERLEQGGLDFLLDSSDDNEDGDEDRSDLAAEKMAAGFKNDPEARARMEEIRDRLLKSGLMKPSAPQIGEVKVEASATAKMEVTMSSRASVASFGGRTRQSSAPNRRSALSFSGLSGRKRSKHALNANSDDSDHDSVEALRNLKPAQLLPGLVPDETPAFAEDLVAKPGFAPTGPNRTGYVTNEFTTKRSLGATSEVNFSTDIAVAMCGSGEEENDGEVHMSDAVNVTDRRRSRKKRKLANSLYVVGGFEPTTDAVPGEAAHPPPQIASAKQIAGIPGAESLGVGVTIVPISVRAQPQVAAKGNVAPAVVHEIMRSYAPVLVSSTQAVQCFVCNVQPILTDASRLAMIESGVIRSCSKDHSVLCGDCATGLGKFCPVCDN